MAPILLTDYRMGSFHCECDIYMHICLHFNRFTLYSPFPSTSDGAADGPIIDNITQGATDGPIVNNAAAIVDNAAAIVDNAAATSTAASTANTADGLPHPLIENSMNDPPRPLVENTANAPHPLVENSTTGPPRPRPRPRPLIRGVAVSDKNPAVATTATPTKAGSSSVSMAAVAIPNTPVSALKRVRIKSDIDGNDLNAKVPKKKKTKYSLKGKGRAGDPFIVSDSEEATNSLKTA